MGKYRAVLFDFNGVIVDDEALHEAAFRTILERNGQSLSHTEYTQYFSGRSDRDGWSVYLAANGNLGQDIDLLCSQKSEIYERLASENTCIYPEVEHTLQKISSLGLRLGLVTGARRVEVEVALASFRTDIRFEVLVSADDNVLGKPRPDSYLLGASELKVFPEECIVIEDTPSGVKAAKQAGMFCIAVTNTHSIDDLRQADVVVSSLNEIDWSPFCMGLDMHERLAA